MHNEIKKQLLDESRGQISITKDHKHIIVSKFKYILTDYYQLYNILEIRKQTKLRI